MYYRYQDGKLVNDVGSIGADEIHYLPTATILKSTCAIIQIIKDNAPCWEFVGIKYKGPGWKEELSEFYSWDLHKNV